MESPPVISSRTPEGLPNRCPVCKNAVCVEPSQPVGDAPCPVCGALLWFLETDNATLYFDPADSEFITLIASRLGGVDPEALRAGRFDELGVESLDVADLIVELGERFR